MAWRYVESPHTAAPLPVRLIGVWRHRRLLRRMAERDLRQRYVGSTLGLAWAAVNPLLFVGIYTVIFAVVFGGRLSASAPTTQYALYVVGGLLPWVAFADVAGKATQTMSEHRNLVKYVVFPVQILPLTSLYTTAFSQAIGLGAVVVLAAWQQGGPTPSLLLLVPALVCQIAFLAGISWMLGAIGTVLRDIKELVTVLLMAGMFVTPIFYLERDVPSRLQPLIAMNPMTYLVRLYRDALIGPAATTGSTAVNLLVFGAIAAVTLVVGFAIFERTRVFLSDIL